MKTEIISFDAFQVKIQFSKKWNRYEGLHRAINPKTKEPLQKWGFDFDSLHNTCKETLVSEYLKTYQTK
jgi:hypothetical protein